MSFKNRDIIKIGDLSKDELLFILETAKNLCRNIKSPESIYKKLLHEYMMIYAFFEDSTRTRTSFIESMAQLGGNVQGFAGPAGTSINKGESIFHTIKMYENYGGNIIVVRHKLDGTAQWLSDKFEIPVINAGDGTHEHPTQALLDLYTILETQGRLDNLNVVMVGDLRYGRTTHSLATALSLFSGNKFYFVSPEFLKMPQRFTKMLKDRNNMFYETEEISEVLPKADILYVTRVQKERVPDDIKANYEKIKDKFKIEKALLNNVKPNLKIMHPLPIDKTVKEISSDVEDTEYSYYFQQAKNGLYIRMTLLGLVLGKIASPDFPKKTSADEPTNFEEVDIPSEDKANQHIKDICNGVVIDHLPAGSALDIIKHTGYNNMDNVFIGLHLNSKKYGKKDIIKVESDELKVFDLSLLNRIALIAPNATISLINNRRIARKGKVRLPSEIQDLLICPNGNCVSRPEHNESVISRFRVIERDNLLLECHYCETQFSAPNIYFKE